MGVGAEYTTPLNEDLSISFGANTFSESDTFNESGINYTGDVDFKNLSVIANYNPFSDTTFFKNFRLRAGVFINNNEINLSAVNNNGSTINIGGTNYNTDITLNSVVSFDTLNPYFGIGWGSATTNDGFNFVIDIGVISTGLDATLDCTGGGCNAISAGDLDRERNELNEALDDLDLYPVIGIGLSWSF